MKMHMPHTKWYLFSNIVSPLYSRGAKNMLKNFLNKKKKKRSYTLYIAVHL